MKKQVEDWIILADMDLRASEIVMKNDYPLTPNVGCAFKNG